MEKVFEIASNVSTPLGLAGLVMAIFFFIARQALATTRSKSRKGEALVEDKNLANLIINRLFQLSLLAMILGFCGFIFTKVYAQAQKQGIINATIFVNGKEQNHITVHVLEIEATKTTNEFGRVSIPYYVHKGNFTFTFEGFDTIITLSSADVENDLAFHLSRHSLATLQRSDTGIEDQNGNNGIQFHEQSSQVHEGLIDSIGLSGSYIRANAFFIKKNYRNPNLPVGADVVLILNGGYSMEKTELAKHCNGSEQNEYTFRLQYSINGRGGDVLKLFSNQRNFQDYFDHVTTLPSIGDTVLSDHSVRIQVQNTSEVGGCSNPTIPFIFSPSTYLLVKWHK